MIAVLLAEGFEEIEALAPVDVLRRASLDVKTVGISEKHVTGSHGITVTADLTADEVDIDGIDAVILPGGMPGALNLDASPFVDRVVSSVMKKGGRVAAICAAPLVLGRRGFLRGRLATCFPGFEGELVGASFCADNVVTDGNITTANGMTSALQFADELARLLSAPQVKKSLQCEEKKAAEPQKATDYGFADYSGYKTPSSTLLKRYLPEDAAKRAEEEKNYTDAINEVFALFKVKASVTHIERGPRLTRYEIVPEKGVKVTSVTRLFNDIALSLGVEGMRMQAPIPGKSAIGIEIPNKTSEPVLLGDLMDDEEFSSGSSTLFALGKDVVGKPRYADITKLPHLIVAGATGMGKSVCINSILVSLLYKARPDELKLILIDPKKVEFSAFSGIPHLLLPVITDAKEAAGALTWAVEEMERRYDLMEALNVRKLDSYNERVRENPELGSLMPRIVIVIDELSDIMLTVKNPAEDLIMSLAQKARAAGIHLIIGTQRPTVDVLTGVIKANIPSRISFKLASHIDSRTVLDQTGAEKLLPMGDMLYTSVTEPKAVRIQGAFVSDGEVSSVIKFLKEQSLNAPYSKTILDEVNEKAKSIKSKQSRDESDEDGEDSYLNDEKFLCAVDISLDAGKISTSLLQRKLSIGYGKAAKFIDIMQELGIASEPCGQKPREVLITKDEWNATLERNGIKR